MLQSCKCWLPMITWLQPTYAYVGNQHLHDCNIYMTVTNVYDCNWHLMTFTKVSDCNWGLHDCNPRVHDCYWCVYIVWFGLMQTGMQSWAFFIQYPFSGAYYSSRFQNKFLTKQFDWALSFFWHQVTWVIFFVSKFSCPPNIDKIVFKFMLTCSSFLISSRSSTAQKDSF